MRGVDHDPLRFAALARQFGENLVEHAQATPANEPIVDRLVRAIVGRSVAPTQPVLDHEHDRADDPPIVHPRDPMRERKIPLNPTHLNPRQQKQISHGQASQPPPMNQPIRAPARTLIGPEPSSIASIRQEETAATPTAGAAQPSFMASALCSCSRKRNRWIFPVAVFGNSGMKAIARGYLYGASRSLTKLFSSASFTEAPSFKTTNALDLISPSASGAPITAASRTEGCCTSVASTSNGLTHTPPTFSMSSERPA